MRLANEDVGKYVMVGLLDMKQAARVVQDENGNPVVQVPLAVWEAVVVRIDHRDTEFRKWRLLYEFVT